MREKRAWCSLDCALDDYWIASDVNVMCSCTGTHPMATPFVHRLRYLFNNCEWTAGCRLSKHHVSRSSEQKRQAVDDGISILLSKFDVQTCTHNHNVPQSPTAFHPYPFAISRAPDSLWLCWFCHPFAIRCHHQHSHRNTLTEGTPDA